MVQATFLTEKTRNHSCFLSLSRGEYDKAKEYFEKALAIAIEICDRAQEARCYGYLGTLYLSHGEYGKAKEFVEKALASELKLVTKREKQQITET